MDKNNVIKLVYDVFEKLDKLSQSEQSEFLEEMCILIHGKLRHSHGTSYVNSLLLSELNDPEPLIVKGKK